VGEGTANAHAVIQSEWRQYATKEKLYADMAEDARKKGEKVIFAFAPIRNEKGTWFNVLKTDCAGVQVAAQAKAAVEAAVEAMP
jgi:hypothetical protein